MNRVLAYCCLALSMSVVGSYIALSKPLTAVFPVFLLGWLRFGFAAVAMLHWLKKPADEAPLSKQTRSLLFMESFFGNFLFSVCMLFGVSMTNAVSAGVIMAAIPAVIALMSWALLGERITARIWAALVCALGGIVLLALSPVSDATQASNAVADAQAHPLLGNILICCAVVCEASYAVIGKKLTAALSPRRISSLINLWGFVLMTPFGLYAALHFDFTAVHVGSWMLMVFYSLAASVWTVWLWMTGLKTVPANQAGVFSVLLPVSATLVGVLVLGETLTPIRALALGIALLGVVLATVPERKAPQAVAAT
jgi:drug/metabolite transporter (DMT)-like permease